MDGARLMFALSKQVEILDPVRDSDWDQRVAAFPDATVFHTSGWAKVLHASYGYRFLGFALNDDDRPAALMPIAEVNSRLTGRRGVGLPFTDECAPLGRSTERIDELERTVLAEGGRRGWRSFGRRGGPDVASGRIPASVEYLGHQLNLARSESDVFDSFSRATRRALRMAGEAGLEVTASADDEAMETYFGLHCVTRRRHGLPPQPARFFKALQGELPAKGGGFVVLARSGGRAVAGAVFLSWNGRAVYKFGASNEAGRRLRANHVVMWEGMRTLISEGARSLSFGRTALAQEGLRRFKLGWGTTETRIQYSKFDYRQNQYVIDVDRATGWHNRVFKNLPVPVSRWIGTILYPHLA